MQNVNQKNAKRETNTILQPHHNNPNPNPPPTVTPVLMHRYNACDGRVSGTRENCFWQSPPSANPNLNQSQNKNCTPNPAPPQAQSQAPTLTHGCRNVQDKPIPSNTNVNPEPRPKHQTQPNPDPQPGTLNPTPTLRHGWTHARPQTQPQTRTPRLSHG